MEPFLAQIIMFGGNYAPRGWAFCDGQLLPVSQYSALFSLLGTTYGGDGRTTFGLPDLRGRVPKHEGNGAGLSPVRLGEKGGRENVTLTINELPSHNHGAALSNGQAAVTFKATADEGTSDEADGNILASGISKMYTASNAADQVALAPAVGDVTGTVAIGNTGNSRSFSIENPYLGINYIIALQGAFPSRS